MLLADKFSAHEIDAKSLEEEGYQTNLKVTGLIYSSFTLKNKRISYVSPSKYCQNLPTTWLMNYVELEDICKPAVCTLCGKNFVQVRVFLKRCMFSVQFDVENLFESMVTYTVA